MGVWKQNLTMEEFFEAYKNSKKMLSTYITYPEYEKIILTLNSKEKDSLIQESWEVFEHTSDDRIDYNSLIERINLAVS